MFPQSGLKAGHTNAARLHASKIRGNHSRVTPYGAMRNPHVSARLNPQRTARPTPVPGRKRPHLPVSKPCSSMSSVFSCAMRQTKIPKIALATTSAIEYPTCSAAVAVAPSKPTPLIMYTKG